MYYLYQRYKDDFIISDICFTIFLKFFNLIMIIDINCFNDHKL